MVGAAVATWLGFRFVFAMVALSFAGVILLALPLWRVVAPQTKGNIPA